ncbi:MAG TPA: hypothetical protein ENF37_04170, partial [Beggiatoa sp.]|nr:hypothetical protein [Beggiatoa sp.]
MIDEDELQYLMCIQRHCAMVQMDLADQLKTIEDIKIQKRIIEGGIGRIRIMNDDIAKYILASSCGHGWPGIFEELEETFSKVVGEDKARYWFERLKQESKGDFIPKRTCSSSLKMSDVQYLMCIQRHCAMVQMDLAHPLKTVENITTHIKVIEVALGEIRIINDVIAKYILASSCGH